MDRMTRIGFDSLPANQHAQIGPYPAGIERDVARRTAPRAWLRRSGLGRYLHAAQAYPGKKLARRVFQSWHRRQAGVCASHARDRGALASAIRRGRAAPALHARAEVSRLSWLPSKDADPFRAGGGAPAASRCDRYVFVAGRNSEIAHAFLETVSSP